MWRPNRLTSQAIGRHAGYIGSPTRGSPVYRLRRMPRGSFDRHHSAGHGRCSRSTITSGSCIAGLQIKGLLDRPCRHRLARLVDPAARSAVRDRRPDHRHRPIEARLIDNQLRHPRTTRRAPHRQSLHLRHNASDGAPVGRSPTLTAAPHRPRANGAYRRSSTWVVAPDRDFTRTKSEGGGLGAHEALRPGVRRSSHSPLARKCKTWVPFVISSSASNSASHSSPVNSFDDSVRRADTTRISVRRHSSRSASDSSGHASAAIAHSSCCGHSDRAWCRRPPRRRTGRTRRSPSRCRRPAGARGSRT
jgi:hypothetical protein